MATQNVSEEQLQSQFTYIDAVARLLGDKRPKAYTHTFGCQQNEADTERIRGMLSEMGYEMTDTPDEADFILFNTCAVRLKCSILKLALIFGLVQYLREKRSGRALLLQCAAAWLSRRKTSRRLRKAIRR